MPGVFPICLMSLGTATEATASADELMAVAPKMVILTWIAFLMVAWILHRMAWKPILNALELRENRIRRALDEAAQAEKSATTLQSQNAVLLQSVRDESQKLLEDARRLAADNARTIEERAQAQARNLVQDAHREIDAAVVKARDELRRESADLALALAERVIGENMDSPRNRVLIEKQLEGRGR